MEKPNLYFKLWAWMLFKANFKDHGKLKRGQFLTSISDMQDAMSYMSGYRKIRPSKDEIRGAYGAFTGTSMITTAKTTRGMIITILNYDKYQNPKNYGAHSEPHNENLPEPTVAPHYKGKKEERKENIPPLFKIPSKFIKEKTREIYEAFPKKADQSNSLKSIERLLRTYPDELLPCPVPGLKSVIQNYRERIEAEGIKPKFQIQSNNFFGQAERWKEFLEKPITQEPGDRVWTT